MVDDVLLNKAAAVERAVKRIRELHAGDDANLANRTRQDAMILALQRAVENAIDAAMHLVRVHRLGIPQETLEAFEMLERANLLAPQLAEPLKELVRFRHALVYDDESVDAAQLRRAVAEGPDTFLAFTAQLLRAGAGR